MTNTNTQTSTQAQAQAQLARPFWRVVTREGGHGERLILGYWEQLSDLETFLNGVATGAYTGWREITQGSQYALTHIRPDFPAALLERCQRADVSQMRTIELSYGIRYFGNIDDEWVDE